MGKQTIWSTRKARKVPPHPVVPLMRSYRGGSLRSFARPKESTGNGDAVGRRSHKRLLSGGQPGRCYEVNKEYGDKCGASSTRSREGCGGSNGEEKYIDY